MEEEKIRLTTLVKRLFAIDAKLNGETAQLVSEYNQIVEEIYMTLEGLRQKTDPPKVLSLTKNGGNVK